MLPLETRYVVEMIPSFDLIQYILYGMSPHQTKEAIAKATGKNYSVGVSNDLLGYRPAGTSADWVAEQFQVLINFFVRTYEVVIAMAGFPGSLLLHSRVEARARCPGDVQLHFARRPNRPHRPGRRGVLQGSGKPSDQDIGYKNSRLSLIWPFKNGDL